MQWKYSEKLSPLKLFSESETLSKHTTFAHWCFRYHFIQNTEQISSARVLQVQFTKQLTSKNLEPSTFIKFVQQT